MKHSPAFILILIITYANAFSQHALKKRWSTDTVLAVPESVFFDENNHVLYASLINGEGDVKDNIGGLAKVGLDGKIIDANWVTGLNAPKGITKSGNNLYVADITDVVVVVDIP